MEWYSAKISSRDPWKTCVLFRLGSFQLVYRFMKVSLHSMIIKGFCVLSYLHRSETGSHWCPILRGVGLFTYFMICFIDGTRLFFPKRVCSLTPRRVVLCRLLPTPSGWCWVALHLCSCRASGTNELKRKNKLKCVLNWKTGNVHQLHFTPKDF